MTLDKLAPLPGTRDYLEEYWFSPGDIVLARSGQENAEAFSEEIKSNFAKGLSSDPNDIPAFSGRKYDDYGGYGACIEPVSIFEVGVAAGYSIAAMMYHIPRYVDRVTLVDMHHDVWRTTYKLSKYHPDVKFSTFQYDTQTPDWECVDLDSEYDIVHIDGNHTYSGALNDLVHFGCKVSQRGLIIVDDAKDPNILRACDEFRDANNMESRFISNHNGHYLMMRRQ